MKKQYTISIFFITLLLLISFCSPSVACMKSPPPKIAKDVIIIGDRVVDIASNLGVLPRAMSVRGALWAKAKVLKTGAQIIGCPKCIVNKPDKVPNACKKFGIKRLIIEKSDPYCLYMKNVRPENIVPIMKGKGVSIEYVDLTKGIEHAVRQTADLFGCPEKADSVVAGYKKKMKRAEDMLPKAPLKKKVLILNGTYQTSSGKLMLRVEAPGGYSDQFILSRLGCVNVGDAFKPANGKTSKGHFFIKKSRKGLDLTPLLNASPEVIVMMGDVFGVQKALERSVAKNPAFLKVPAIQQMKLYALPRYIDSGILEYPEVLQKWTAAFVQ